MARERILRPEVIPNSLWDDGTLFLPTSLAEAYATVIDSAGLLALAGERDRASPPVGGLSQEATNKHFAQAFDGSVARALLAILDPKGEAGSTSDTFIRTIAGNAVCITDAPCGAGAATLAFLSALAELRATQVLPRLPLTVSIVGGEISEPAAVYARRLFEIVTPYLNDQAIFINHSVHSWDVTDPISTTDLVTHAVREGIGASSKLLVVANFNGFLESSGNRSKALPQLEELFRYASGENSFAVWIEPNMKRATSASGLFSAISKFFSTFWAKHVSGKSGRLEGQEVFTSTAEYQRPLFRPAKAKVRLAVMPINLERSAE